ncbi:MAG TPA: formate/nitrite transporter family protein [Solirubrobacteraceae bacterium]|nr:formate/nitrite transporter family protein [Solirubrobacteraceae bacterium]
MSGRRPDEIWQAAVDEGERRLTRGTWALASTGFVGGADIMIGVLALTATTGALHEAVGAPIAHLAGSLLFGLGFVFLIIGRGELFTENFLVPVSAVLARRAPRLSLLRLWLITFVANYAGILLIVLLMAKTGVLEPATLEAAGPLTETLVERDALAALFSGVLAGAVMTLMTWLTHAVELDVSRILLCLGIGFVISVASMNHAVVSFGETMLAYVAGTTDAGLGEIARTIAFAIAGNLIGGLGLVTLNRGIQARGEPG